MLDARLIINGQEFPVHYKLLRAIAANLPQDKNYAPLAPEEFRPSFAQCAEKGMMLRGIYLEKMTADDLPALARLSFENLKMVAGCVEMIKDTKVREKALDFLCSHPDPAIRLELVENIWAPKSILQRLANDADPDVQRTARDDGEYEDE